MAAPTYYPRNIEEHLIWWSIVGTWGFYLLGGLYILGPVLAWLLLALIGLRSFFQDLSTPPAKRIRCPPGVLIWIGGMLVMEVALIIGHLDQGLGIAQTIKSTIGWMKGWALLALFQWAGASLVIRPQLLYRAASCLALQTLFLIPVFLVAAWIGFPESLYVSPLKFVGGPGPEFFEVQLYQINPESGQPRWRFFAPWAPAAGFMANLYLIFALREKSQLWRAISILAVLLVCLMSQSRLALVAMVAVTGFTWGASNLTRPAIAGLATIVVTCLVAAANWLLRLVEDAILKFNQARPGSSRVRAALARIALHRWRSEAFLFGHGVVEKGPHLVEYMPIGSHHTWYGLLFVKGLVGFVALAVPMTWSAIEMLIKAQASRTAQTGLAVVTLLFLYTFGENLEILAYLLWPGFVVMGIACRQPLKNPLRRYLSGDVRVDLKTG